MQMVYRPTKPALRDLYALAQSQGGYFTAKQAAELGYLSTHLNYHLKRGNFARAGHGYYRLPEIPPAAHDDLIRLTFWSRDRDDQPQAVASHQTALAVHELSDLLPRAIHLTVPLSFRKPATRGVVLHRAELPPTDIDEREGFSVTTPLRTLIDSAAEGSIAEEHLKRAVRQALERGLVRKTKLLQAAKDSSSEGRLSRIIKAVR
jgi:predicted transcriptional regulator of viral defense system